MRREFGQTLTLSIVRKLYLCLFEVCNTCVCLCQWKDNPSLSESQIQSMALGRQATCEMELKHREAIYRDVLGKQQTVRLLSITQLLFLHSQTKTYSDTLNISHTVTLYSVQLRKCS